MESVNVSTRDIESIVENWFNDDQFLNFDPDNSISSGSFEQLMLNCSEWQEQTDLDYDDCLLWSE